MTTLEMTVKAKKMVEEYTGAHVLDVVVATDPIVRDVVAIRANLRGEKTAAEFLVTGFSKATADDLEEVEFTSWPPMAKF